MKPSRSPYDASAKRSYSFERLEVGGAVRESSAQLVERVVERLDSDAADNALLEELVRLVGKRLAQLPRGHKKLQRHGRHLSLRGQEEGASVRQGAIGQRA